MRDPLLRPAARAVALLAALAAAASPAQPVRLRLAASLCTSMTAQVLASQQVPPLVSGAAGDTSVNATLGERLARDRDSHFARLDGLVPFNGLYVTGMADRTFADHHGGRYSFGLEWELFD